VRWLRRAAALLCLALGHADVHALAQGERMDVVVIVADDLGWSDVSPRVPTPSLERLARAGTTFRGAYAMPVCTPSRYAMLFGRYGRRAGVLAGARTLVPEAAPAAEHAAPSLAELFRGAGYSTAAFGKWHVDPPSTPLAELARAHGFQTFRAGTRGNLGRERTAYTRWTRIDDGVESECTQYATLAVRDAFRDWWRATDGPRFAWVAFHAPHQPFHAPPSELLAEGARLDSNRGCYEAAVRALDRVLGELLDTLDLQHTLLVFVGDNGTPPLAAAPGAEPAHQKASVFEGGVHVPLFVAGPGVRAGVECTALVHVVDLMATLAEFSGAALPAGAAEDSRSFAALLREPGGRGPRATVFFEIRGGEEGETRDELGVRSATHKLRIVGDGPGRREELYDLGRDPDEKQPLDLAEPANRAVRDELARALEALPPRR